MFLKLIESRQTKIGWDYLCVKFLNCGITNVCVPPSWGGTLGAKPANIWAQIHFALQENCCDRELLFLERFEQTNSSLAVLHKLGFCLLKRVFFNMQVFITVSLIYCDFVLKKKLLLNSVLD